MLRYHPGIGLLRCYGAASIIKGPFRFRQDISIGSDGWGAICSRALKVPAPQIPLIRQGRESIDGIRLEFGRCERDWRRQGVRCS
jgi:hypothetical protein